MSEQAFSASVALTLNVDGIDLPLSHVGPDFFVLQNAGESVSAGIGKLTIRIDDHIETTPVQFERSQQGGVGRINYSPIVEASTPATTVSRS